MKKLLFIYLLITFSANAQWVRYPTPIGSSIDNIHFFNKDIGIITSGNKVFKSTDGGENWTNTNLTLPSRNFFIVDSLYWWSINSVGFYRTTNGGALWTSSMLPDSNQYSDEDELFFINRNVGFLGESGQILRTTDGGLTWSTVYSLDDNLIITDFSFCSDSIGVGVAGSQYIIKTTDSGRTWDKISQIDDYYYHSGVCLSNSKMVTIMWNIKQGVYEVLVSSDGGSNWESTFSFNRPPHELAFTSDNIGFVSSSAIYKTTNSGKNWFVQTDPNVSPSADYRHLYVLDENYCWVSNYWDLFKTENGGGERFHFFSIDYPNTGDTLYALTEIKIRWSNFSRRDVNIKFSSDNGQTWIDLATDFNSENHSYFYWNVPDIQSDQCRLLIENYWNISESEETGNFTIAPPPPLILTSPARNSYHHLTGGFYLNISWLAFNVDKIKIEFSPDSGLTWQPIANLYPADSLKYRWRIPFITSNGCLIKITDIDNPSIYALTNIYFTITLPYLLITYPNKSSVFHSGDIELLRMAGNYAGAMKLELTTDNGRSWLFIDSLNSSDWGDTWSQSYEWLIPDLYSDSCRLRLTVDETDSFIGISSNFKINNKPTVEELIASASPGDTIYLTEAEYVECIQIKKPIVLIGDGISQTEIKGDTLKPVITIQSSGVVIKNLTVSAKPKSVWEPYNCSNHSPTNGIEILNSHDIALDSLQIFGGEDIGTDFNVSGGIGLLIKNSQNINVSGSRILGANAKIIGESRCGSDGGDGLRIINCDSLKVLDCKITGGQGANGWSHGATPSRGDTEVIP